MKHILCFGDSLTWGFIPSSGKRYPFAERWTGATQNVLGDSYTLIEAGMNARTTVFEDPFLADRNGAKALPIYLSSNASLDLVIIMLGTNDIKPYICGSAKQAATGCGSLIRQVLSSHAGTNRKAPPVLLLSPPAYGKLSGFMETNSDNNTIAESQQFALHYQRIAKVFGATFLDTASIVTASKVDGVHLDATENKLSQLSGNLKPLIHN